MLTQEQINILVDFAAHLHLKATQDAKRFGQASLIVCNIMSERYGIPEESIHHKWLKDVSTK